MNKAVQAAKAGARRKQPAPASNPSEKPVRRPMFRPPLRPRPGLFYGLLGLLGIWIAILLTLYFVTVRPYRAKYAAPVQEGTPPDGTVSR
jgi:hypothetical protein